MSRKPKFVIDAWCQPCDAEFAKKVPETRRLFEKSGTLDMQSITLNPRETVELLDKAKVDKVLLSAWSRPYFTLFSNNDIFKYMNDFPDRFYGLATVDLYDPVKACFEIEECAKKGFKGVRIVQWLWNLSPNDKLIFAICPTLVKHDLPLCIQAGHTGPLMPSETGRPVPYIDELALRFPKLKIVCGHIGHPWTEEMIGVAWKHDNVFIDTSAYLPTYYPPALITFMKTYGQDKVMFGTNWPQLPWDKCVNAVEKLNLSQPILEKFMWKNASKVFKIPMNESRL